MLGRKEVDRKLGGEPSGQSTGVERGNKGKNQGGKGNKKAGNREPGEGEKGGL